MSLATNRILGYDSRDTEILQIHNKTALTACSSITIGGKSHSEVIVDDVVSTMMTMRSIASDGDGGEDGGQDQDHDERGAMREVQSIPRAAAETENESEKNSKARACECDRDR